MDKGEHRTGDQVMVSILEPYIKALQEINLDTVAKIAMTMALVGAAEGRIFIMGNGGSASTADHFASDLQAVGPRAISLCANTAIITRLANDHEYRNVFRKQLSENDLGMLDLVVGISASGNSENVLRAMLYAESVKAGTIGISGFAGAIRGGTLQRLVRENLVISSQDYGVVEGAHSCLCHMIVTEVKRLLEGK